jgi:cell division protein FtsN
MKDIECFYYISVTSIHKRSPTDGGSTFATYTEHTPAFNTLHFISAVIGVVGAIAVAITVCIICKRRRNQKRKDSGTQAINCPPSADIESHLTTASLPSNRFGQFASDFDNIVEPPKPAVAHVEDISPMMQQYQLQLMLLQQQQQERREKTTTTTTTTIIQDHHRASASSSNINSSSSAPVLPSALLPPPPYQP